MIEEKGVTYLHLDGNADHVMQYMVTDYKTSADFMKGLMKLKKKVLPSWSRPWKRSRVPI